MRADAVDGDALRNPFVDVVDHAFCYFCVVRDVEVVVVDIQLRIRVRCPGRSESNSNKVLTQNSLEVTIAQVAVLGEDLVYDVPLEDLAFVMGYDLGDVVLDHGGQRVAVVDLGYPAGELGVPEKGVAADEFSVLGCEVYDGVRVCEGEFAALS